MNRKRSNRYEVKLAVIDDRGNDDQKATTLAFEVQNHDDLFVIAERVRRGSALSDSDANALTVGLKLFAGVMLAHPQLPMFVEVRPTVQAFIRNLKTQVAAAPS